MSEEDEIVDPDFTDLPLAEQLIVWAIRMWVKGYKDGDDVLPLMGKAFEKVGAVDACVAIDRLMNTLAVGAIDAIDIRYPEWETITPDEHRLLGVLAAWQCTGIGDDADTLMGKILTPTGVRYARPAFYELAIIMKYAGLLVRPRFERPICDAANHHPMANSPTSVKIH